MTPLIKDLKCATEECLVIIKKKQTLTKDYFSTVSSAFEKWGTWKINAFQEILAFK